MIRDESSLREFHYPDAAAFTLGVANVIRDALRAALAERERASVVVPGGSTPGPVFDRLASEELAGDDVDWSRVDITLSDERWVPPTHADSNEALVRSRLLRGPATAARFLGLYRDLPRPSDAIVAVTHALQSLARPFDVVLLGVGDDGHFASLFPSRPELATALAMESKDVLVALDSPALGRPRISLNLAALCDARRIMLALRGERKRAVLRQAFEPGCAESLPLRALLRQTAAPVELHWSP